MALSSHSSAYLSPAAFLDAIFAKSSLEGGLKYRSTASSSIVKSTSFSLLNFPDSGTPVSHGLSSTKGLTSFSRMSSAPSFMSWLPDSYASLVAFLEAAIMSCLDLSSCSAGSACIILNFRMMGRVNLPPPTAPAAAAAPPIKVGIVAETIPTFFMFSGSHP